MYHCLEDDNEMKLVTDNWSRDDNTSPTAEISDDSSIESDEEDMNINPSKTIFTNKSKCMKINHLKM